MVNDPNKETNWGTQSIVIKSPVLAKRVKLFETWLEKRSVKSWQLGNVIAGEPIHGMRAPKLV